MAGRKNIDRREPREDEVEKRAPLKNHDSAPYSLKSSEFTSRARRGESIC